MLDKDMLADVGMQLHTARDAVSIIVLLRIGYDISGDFLRNLHEALQTAC